MRDKFLTLFAGFCCAVVGFSVLSWATRTPAVSGPYVFVGQYEKGTAYLPFVITEGRQVYCKGVKLTPREAELCKQADMFYSEQP